MSVTFPHRGCCCALGSLRRLSPMSGQAGEMSPSAAAVLEDDDLLSEILLRLPPQPSSLPRASAVCKRWFDLVSAPRFVRRFRLRHRRNPPLLGLIREVADGLRFQPTMEARNRVPRGRFSLQLDHCTLLGCRHGLVLALNASWDQILVWDPVTGDQHRAATPPGLDMEEVPIDGTVLRDAGEDHFQVVLLGYAQDQNPRAVVCVYSSETGVWSNLIETQVAEDAMDNAVMPAVLVGDSLHWLLWDWSVVLEFDLGRQSLGVIQLPKDMFVEEKYVIAMRAEGGTLGLLSLSEHSIQLWKMNTDADGVSSWVLGRTIELDRLLTLDSKREIRDIEMVGYAEENNVVYLRTAAAGIFMVQLDSLEFKKLPENNNGDIFYSFESVYAAETSIGGGHDGADQHMLV